MTKKATRRVLKVRALTDIYINGAFRSKGSIFRLTWTRESDPDPKRDKVVIVPMATPERAFPIPDTMPRSQREKSGVDAVHEEVDELAASLGVDDEEDAPADEPSEEAPTAPLPSAPSSGEAASDLFD